MGSGITWLPWAARSDTRDDPAECRVGSRVANWGRRAPGSTTRRSTSNRPASSSPRRQPRRSAHSRTRADRLVVRLYRPANRPSAFGRGSEGSVHFRWADPSDGLAGTGCGMCARSGDTTVCKKNPGHARYRCACRKLRPCGSGCSVILVDDASEAVASAYVQLGDFSRIADRFGYRTERGCLIHGLVGAVPVAVLFELPERPQKVALVPDQGAIEEFVAQFLYPALHDRVHAGCANAGEDGCDAGVAEDLAEPGGDLASRSRIRYATTASAVLVENAAIQFDLGDRDVR